MEQTADGPLPMIRHHSMESNLDRTSDYRIRKLASDLPPKGIDDQVTLNPNRQYADTQNRPVPRSGVAFHELAEAYAKVDKGLQYNDSLVVVGGAVLAGFSEQGAHNDAVQRELKLRDQRPSLRSTGRAGDEELHQIVRDPHK